MPTLPEGAGGSETGSGHRIGGLCHVLPVASWDLQGAAVTLLRHGVGEGRLGSSVAGRGACRKRNGLWEVRGGHWWAAFLGPGSGSQLLES